MDFIRRHIGPSQKDIQSMLGALGCDSLESFIDKVLPSQIRTKTGGTLTGFEAPVSESDTLKRLQEYASMNEVRRSYIGMGYYSALTPTVILRNITENPGWYTQYTPYQPEISQGRLEALLNFQTMVSDLTGLPITNASMLDEGTAAAEAMNLAFHHVNKDACTRDVFLISADCFPQTKEVVRTRALPLGIKVEEFSGASPKLTEKCFGVMWQYPGCSGELTDVSPGIDAARKAGALTIVAADILALALVKSPGELGADIAVGSTQRFGIPLGYGGPHAAFFSCKEDFKRVIPGRIVGVSKDSNGKPALRLALQTREQHIRREKATSNICTAQVLLAVMAGMYAVYHGPKGIKEIAERVHGFALEFAQLLKEQGYAVTNEPFFDTVAVRVNAKSREAILRRADSFKINLRIDQADTIAVSFDETVTPADLSDLAEIFSGSKPKGVGTRRSFSIPANLQRKSPILSHPVFNRYHSETECLRYMKRLESRDLSLCHSMIPLGSCTMKLNASTEMIPITWKEFGALHPFAPKSQARGYELLFKDLESALCQITGFAATSLQPNAGSQGEYAGLLVIQAYHQAHGQGHRNICLIPKSAHGTNPASAVMAGMKVVVVNCDNEGNVDVQDLKAKAEQYKSDLSCLMITYPSTHGVFESAVKEIAEVIHSCGGQVYLDGANLNALVGLAKPGEFGADVCHINLHKTFCIPHGGGGPGMGPIGVAKHLAPFLPDHSVVSLGRDKGIGAVSAAPWGSASILPISWSYITMMGREGLRTSTAVAILNANYVAKRLESHYPVVYKGQSGFVAHECILDLSSLKTAGVEVEDVAKRLMDYGFHAPTVSWPVPGTIMIEPTESESKEELDRYCDALISIRNEVREIEAGKLDKVDNPLKNAPHTSEVIISDSWERKYSREQAAFPVPWLRDFKFWPSVGRIDAGYGDRNLVCACLPMEEYK